MQAVSPRYRVSGLFDRLAEMDRFGLFLSGFIIVYAATSLAVEHVLGVVGFAKTPYLNGAAYLYTLAFIGLGILFDKVSLRFFLPHPFGLAVLAVLGISCVIGIANDNAVQYIVAWAFYILAGVLVFQFFRNPSRPATSVAGAVERCFRCPSWG